MPKHKELDQFYTSQEVVRQLLEHIDCSAYNLVVEPSAGDGAFVKNIHHDNLLAIDIEPAYHGIKKGDFLTHGTWMVLQHAQRCKTTNSESMLVIGNPPFGKMSNLAIEFFNQSAMFADSIAFVLPRTFRKPSVINRLNINFHLREEHILPPSAFYTPDGDIYDVPTVFQIWDRSKIKRKELPVLKTCLDFDFVFHRGDPEKTRNESDFCIRRVGGLAGKVLDINPKYALPSHYFIKEKRSGVRKIMESLDWSDPNGPKYDTAAHPSISKNDLIRKYLGANRSHTVGWWICPLDIFLTI
jgi:predicted RNA methylase